MSNSLKVDMKHIYWSLFTPWSPYVKNYNRCNSVCEAKEVTDKK